MSSKLKQKKRKTNKKTSNAHLAMDIDSEISDTNSNNYEINQVTANMIYYGVTKKIYDNFEKNNDQKECEEAKKQEIKGNPEKKKKTNQFKFYDKKQINKDLKEKLESFIFSNKTNKSEVIPNDPMNIDVYVKEFLTMFASVKKDKLLSAIFEILDKKDIEINFADFGNYNLTYISEVFKKQKDTKILDVIKTKITKAFEEKGVNSLVIPLLQELFLHDFRLKSIYLKLFTLGADTKTYAVEGEKEIKEKEVFYILFFFFRIKKFQKTSKLDFSGTYMTGECLQRLLYAMIYLNNIQHLDFSTNKIGNIGMLYLGCALRYNLKILHLDVSYNNLNDNALFFFLVCLGFYRFYKIEKKSDFGIIMEKKDKDSEITTNSVETDSSFNNKNNITETEEHLNKLLTDKEHIIKEISEELIEFDKNEEIKIFMKNKMKYKIEDLINEAIIKNFDFVNQEYDMENKQATMLIKINLSNNAEICSGVLMVDLLKCAPLLKHLNLSRTGLNAEAMDLVLGYLVETATEHEYQIPINKEPLGDKDKNSSENKKEDNLAAELKMEIDNEHAVDGCKTNFEKTGEQLISCDIQNNDEYYSSLATIENKTANESPENASGSNSIIPIEIENEGKDEKISLTAAKKTWKFYYNYQTKLEYLLISNLKINQSNLNLLGKFLSSKLCVLKVLNISEVKLTNLETADFFNDLTMCQSLEEIYLKECDIPVNESGSAQKAFLRFVEECPNLKYLSVYFNKLSNEDLFYSVFQAIVKRKNSLKVLDYSKNEVKYSIEEEKNILIECLNALSLKKDTIEFIDITQNLNVLNDSDKSFNFQKFKKVMGDLERRSKYKIIY